MGKIIKDTIHTNGIDIGIYTQDFENEYMPLAILVVMMLVMKMA